MPKSSESSGLLELKNGTNETPDVTDPATLSVMLAASKAGYLTIAELRRFAERVYGVNLPVIKPVPEAAAKPAAIPRPAEIVGVLLRTALKSALEALAKDSWDDCDGAERVGSLHVCRESLEVYYKLLDYIRCDLTG